MFKVSNNYSRRRHTRLKCTSLKSVKLLGANATTLFECVLTILWGCIVRTPPFLEAGRGGEFWLPPRRGVRGIWKIKKIGWKYGAGAGLLKRGELALFLFIFSRFIIFTFRNYPLQICFMHLKKKYFFPPPQFCEKRSF